MAEKGVSVNALAKAFMGVYGGTRDDNRKQIRRHLTDTSPGEEMIHRYAKVLGVPRHVFPPAVSPAEARKAREESLQRQIKKLEAQLAAAQAAAEGLEADVRGTDGEDGSENQQGSRSS